ncbi:lipid asymmetry maintenance protein MlaB [Klebsiella quasipneumoniae]|uniref:lipid asymmetry maintenance protein MlaB n=1 Tax=Klebsiella quasipneumoniae TaxID=1463165 RepID=UPI000BE737BF|nr:lipid asymmetry maintenance protein MlaB [Klebsiella quasipneumoniae]HBW1665380.1 lipid asymmetry maintenance protein MlaB [Klebsiella quasipneumoniae subsp. similipneumoniae]EIY5133836.1 lipid asymmetry maintenance protein MlaB [Klebsiella quasipneumoniae]MBF7804797.1 lipid asymmetry maintenance protein MlaB [Klebsiella quasipneumoniae]MCQ3891045.1 lipid asymmetry maintenance protein MlaB [Klebsiella quasipneumoniae]PDQ02990.1 phospholipid ABC transporter substrate-binding protein [Klebsie
MSGQLSWTRDGETLALHGELDQDLLVPLWEVRAQATAGTAIIDLSQTTRVDTAGLALLMHFVALIRRQGREARLIGKSENLQTLVGLYNLPVDMIP